MSTLELPGFEQAESVLQELAAVFFRATAEQSAPLRAASAPAS